MRGSGTRRETVGCGMRWAWFVLAVYGVMSVVAACALGVDKRAARRGGWRVRERTLHTLELLGGWPGSMVARPLLHHKTRKGSYRLVFAGIVAAHLAAWAAVIWFVLAR